MRTALFPRALLVRLPSGGSREVHQVASDLPPVASKPIPIPCTTADNAPWSKAFGDKSDPFSRTYIQALVTDAECHVLVAGRASSNGIDLGAGQVGGGNLFLGKLDPVGNLLWSKSFAGTPAGEIAGVAVDPSTGEITLAALGQSAAPDFGGGPLPPEKGGNSNDLFIVRFDAAGHHQWSRRYDVDFAGNNAAAFGGRLAIGPTGEIVGVFGVMYPGLAHPSSPLTRPMLQENHWGQLVIKVDGGGERVFAEHFDGVGPYDSSESAGVTVDRHGDVVIASVFSGALNVGCRVLTAEGISAGLVVKLDTEGALKWSRVIPQAIGFSSPTLGADDAIYLPGFFSDGADLGRSTLPAPSNAAGPSLVVLEPNGDPRAVTALIPPQVADYSSERIGVAPTGNAVWLLHSSSQDTLKVVSVEPAGRIVPATRTFHAEVSLGQAELYATVFTLDPAGYVVLAGAIKGTTNFGSGEIGDKVFSDPIPFVAKFAP